MKSGHLFEETPSVLAEEKFQILVRGSGDFFIERIVSQGHASPENFWYQQETTEWVVLLSGGAVLEFETEGEYPLRPGDWVEILAGVRHRVKSTSSRGNTVWLAIHWK